MEMFLDRAGWMSHRLGSRDLIAVVNNLLFDVLNLRSEENNEKWVLNSNAQFTVALMWNKIRVKRDEASWWRLVWHSDYILRFSFIMSVVCKDKLNTKDKLKQQGMVDNNLYVLCGNKIENRD